MGRPKGSKNKPKTEKRPAIRIVRSSENSSPDTDMFALENDPDELPVLPPEPPSRWAWVDEALKTKNVERLAEVLTDIQRLKIELETELASTKADLGQRIKTAAARMADVINEIESLTHTWVLDRRCEVAYLVHSSVAARAEHCIDQMSLNLDEVEFEQLSSELAALSKKTRPLAPSDLQESLPLALEG